MTVNIYEMTQTFDAAATTLTAIEMTVTDTDSANDSKLLDLITGATSHFAVHKDGQVVKTDFLADAYVSSASASDAITGGVYINALANATIADAGLTNNFTIDDTNKRLTFTGINTATFIFSASVSFISTESNEVSRFRIAKNGTTDSDTEVARKLGTGADVGALAIQGAFSLATNDYLELHCTLDAVTGTDTITVQKCNMLIRPV